MVPRSGHQDTHDRGALTAAGTGRVRSGSVGMRNGAWSVSEFRRQLQPTAPGALATPKKGRQSWIFKVHYVPTPGVSMAGSYGGTPTMMPGFSGQHKVGCLPGVIIVLPLDEGSGTFKAGEVHGVNSIHPFHNHLDRGHIHW